MAGIALTPWKSTSFHFYINRNRLVQSRAIRVRAPSAPHTRPTATPSQTEEESGKEDQLRSGQMGTRIAFRAARMARDRAVPCAVQTEGGTGL